MCAKQVKKEPRQVETTGHSWDGIEEYNNPLPRWWVWVFYATIVWGIGYTIAYPAWPLITGATRAIWGQHPRRCRGRDPGGSTRPMPTIKAKLVAADLTAIGADPELATYAEHGRGGGVQDQLRPVPRGRRGRVQGKGYPNLLDDDWLWGGTMEDIHLTVTHGIRNTTDADARYSEMPKFGVDELLDATQIGQVVEYVLQHLGAGA